eukprot:ANDGO_05012.mRNA.1 Serine/threonine-protein kinase smg-1
MNTFGPSFMDLVHAFLQEPNPVLLNQVLELIRQPKGKFALRSKGSKIIESINPNAFYCPSLPVFISEVLSCLPEKEKEMSIRSLLLRYSECVDLEVAVCFWRVLLEHSCSAETISWFLQTVVAAEHVRFEEFEWFTKALSQAPSSAKQTAVWILHFVFNCKLSSSNIASLEIRSSVINAAGVFGFSIEFLVQCVCDVIDAILLTDFDKRTSSTLCSMFLFFTGPEFLPFASSFPVCNMLKVLRRLPSAAVFRSALPFLLLFQNDINWTEASPCLGACRSISLPQDIVDAIDCILRDHSDIAVGAEVFHSSFVIPSIRQPVVNVIDDANQELLFRRLTVQLLESIDAGVVDAGSNFPLSAPLHFISKQMQCCALFRDASSFAPSCRMFEFMTQFSKEMILPLAVHESTSSFVFDTSVPSCQHEFLGSLDDLLHLPISSQTFSRFKTSIFNPSSRLIEYQAATIIESYQGSGDAFLGSPGDSPLLLFPAFAWASVFGFRLSGVVPLILLDPDVLLRFPWAVDVNSKPILDVLVVNCHQNYRVLMSWAKFLCTDAAVSNQSVLDAVKQSMLYMPDSASLDDVIFALYQLLIRHPGQSREPASYHTAFERVFQCLFFSSSDAAEDMLSSMAGSSSTPTSFYFWAALFCPEFSSRNPCPRSGVYMNRIRELCGLLSQLAALSLPHSGSCFNLSSLVPDLQSFFSSNHASVQLPTDERHVGDSLVGCSDSFWVYPTKIRPRRVFFDTGTGSTASFLVKGNENVVFDARCMSFIKVLNSLQPSQLRVRHHDIVPLSSSSGFIRFIDRTIPLNVLYEKWLWSSVLRKTTGGVRKRREKQRGASVSSAFNPIQMYASAEADLVGNGGNGGKSCPANRLRIFKELQAKYSNPHLLRDCTILHSSSPSDFFGRMISLRRSLSVFNIYTYVLGIGDRHLGNILLDTASNECIHIDFNICLDRGRDLKVREVVPYRMTEVFRNVVNRNEVLQCHSYLLTFFQAHHALISQLLELQYKRAPKKYNQWHEVDPFDEHAFSQRIRNVEARAQMGDDDGHAVRLWENATSETNLSMMYEGWCPWI